MRLTVRDMALDDMDFRIGYFHDAPAELLAVMGVDPDLMPDRAAWAQLYEADFARPLEDRDSFGVVWQVDGDPIGFSTVSHIRFGDEAFMHLHIVDPDRRASSLGTEFVRMSADRYFDVLRLRRLFSEPPAFNPAPNRTLQSAGFRYVSTQVRRPGAINLEQTTNLWVLDRSE